MPGDELARNDHTDHRWDDRSSTRSRCSVAGSSRLDAALGDVLARFTGYAQRYSAAMERVERGEHGWVKGVGIDSCHAGLVRLPRGPARHPRHRARPRGLRRQGPLPVPPLVVAEAPAVFVGAGAAVLATAAALREHGRDVQVLERLLETVRTTQGNPNVDTVPNDVWSRVRAALVERGMSHREFADALGTQFSGSTRRQAPQRPDRDDHRRFPGPLLALRGHGPESDEA